MSALALVLALVAGCSEPEPSPAERARRQQQAFEEAEAKARERDAKTARPVAVAPSGEPGAAGARIGLGGSTQQREPAWAVKRRLLEAYGARLTPFQRSALQTSSISTYAEGEAMCKAWIEDNRRFDEGSR
ncbi:MAG TPA: hypothetical protein VHF22_09165 [Planctomycetota bacterium]|nr:hypothetical protein [Planctomycetota bacterium]